LVETPRAGGNPACSLQTLCFLVFFRHLALKYNTCFFRTPSFSAILV
jgi:hypothetical protein